MFEVECPECHEIRTVAAKKPWMQGEQPYQKICRTCCQVGKTKSPEHRLKLSQSVRMAQTPEVLKRKSETVKNNPNAGQQNLIFGKGAGWNKGKTLSPRSEETKAKISESMKKRKGKSNES